MFDNLIKIRYRILFISKSFTISKFNKFYVQAESFNDVLLETYNQFIKIAEKEKISVDKGFLNVDSFYVNDDHDFQIKVEDKDIDKKLSDNHKIFHISLTWKDNKNNNIPSPPLLIKQKKI